MGDIYFYIGWLYNIRDERIIDIYYREYEIEKDNDAISLPYAEHLFQVFNPFDKNEGEE